jgi:hypothetical protein
LANGMSVAVVNFRASHERHARLQPAACVSHAAIELGFQSVVVGLFFGQFPITLASIVNGRRE